jgi:hypothetical protein
MKPKVIEGTLSEIQQQLGGLACAPEERLRVTIEEAVLVATEKRMRNGIGVVPVRDVESERAEAPAPPPEPFRPTEFRNGVPLLPRRETAEPLTTEFVKRLLDEEDEERLRADRTAGR